MILLPLAEKLKLLDSFIDIQTKLLCGRLFRGYTCNICNRKGFYFQDGTSEAIISDTNGVSNRMIISYHLSNFGCICPICARDRIFNYFDTNEITIGKCDFTKRIDLPIVSIIRDGDFSCHFGSNSWNGSFANKNTFEQAFLNLTTYSNILSYIDGKRYFVDSGKYLIRNEFDATEWIFKHQ
jgi:hypothetical protein